MDIIIVLGSRVNGNEIHDELRGRLEVGISLMDEKSRLLLSGGITNHELGKSEAMVMKEYCVSRGVPESSIILEENSLDTIGNGVFSMLEIHGKILPGTIYVVSSCYHMKRSEFIFRKCFGPGYRFDFSHCSNFHRPELDEAKSMELAEHFFSGIADGDIVAIKERLFKLHEMYTSKK